MAFDHVTLHILPSYLGNEYERLEVDVAPDMTVNDVLAAGREEDAYRWAAFMPMTPADSPLAPPDEQRLIHHGSSLFGITDEGLLTAAYGARWNDLLRGVQEGFIEGDPHNLLVSVDRGASGGGPTELTELAYWLWENREQVQFVLGLGAGLVGLEEAVRRPVLAISKARRHAIAKSFRDYGIVSSALVQFIDRRGHWDAERLAKLLGLTVLEAEAALSDVGYRRNEHQLYVLSDEPEARLRRAAFFANAFGSPDALDENGNPIGPLVVDRWSWDLPVNDENGPA